MYMISLALKNLQRNWTRSLLAIVSMALAAGILTAAHSVTSGYFTSGYLMPRTFIAGDIVVLPGGVYLDPQRVDPGDSLSWRPVRQPYLNDLVDLHPQLLETGLVIPEALPRGIDPQRLPAALLEHPEVTAITAYRTLPAYVPPDHQAPLRSRNVEQDLRYGAWEQAMFAGEYFAPHHDGLPVAVISVPAFGVGISPLAPSYPVPAVGQYLELDLPRLVDYADGEPVYDYLHLQRVRLQVIGHFTLPMGTTYQVVGGELEHLQVYWNTPQVLVPAATFEQIWRSVSLVPPGPVQQLSLRVERFYDAGRVAAQLRELLPELTVMTVPEIMELAGRSTGQGAIPRDLALPLTVGSYGIAGMLVVTNMYLLNVGRRRQLGIMKAVGASSGSIMLMVLAESAGYALLGAALGFGVIRLVALVISLLAGVPLLETAVSTAMLGLRVAGVTAAAAVIFGLFPAYEAATVPTLEVLRDE